MGKERLGRLRVRTNLVFDFLDQKFWFVAVHNFFASLFRENWIFWVYASNAT